MGKGEHTGWVDGGCHQVFDNDDRDNGGDGWMAEQDDADIMARQVLDAIRERYITDPSRCIHARGIQTRHDEFELRCELEDMGMPCLKDLGDDCEMYQSEGE